jgi:hypothetical protein
MGARGTMTEVGAREICTLVRNVLVRKKGKEE